MSQEAIMNLGRNALRTLSVALIVGLGFFSEAVAQSGDPIRIGVRSLALTGAGASPSKVINTALEIWRDDINAKGGLLGGRSNSSSMTTRVRRPMFQTSTPS